MGRITYSSLMSLDGYIADRDGNFDWAFPAGNVHDAANEDAATAGTFAMGRRLWDVMRWWDDIDLDDPEVDAATAEFTRVWRAADKLVYSRSLTSVDAPRTTLAGEFDPVALRALADASEMDVSVGGADLAAQAFAAGIVDVVTTWIFPVTIGAGLAAFPTDTRVDLELLTERRLDGGVTELRYRGRR